eukprot:TRINITY_DN48549_c0_g1_i1.p1 TRINITY_DN48549_c0_g1~~TRINITY_DN48549_c0_g1_i1.p1  ORF type:complete len:458 (+),score=71.43 TRINITY_DN48549_c0_g1_i1:75-1448(+)
MSVHSNRETEFLHVIRIIIGLFVGYGYFNTMRGTFPQQMRAVAHEMEIPFESIGLPNSLFSAAYGIGKFLTSICSDYVPCAEFHALGLFLSGLAVCALGTCTDFSSMAVLWGLQGILQAFGWPLLARVVVAELPEKQRAKYWGTLSMAGNLGSMLTPYGMVLAKHSDFSWRGAFFAAGFSGIIVSFVVWWLLCCGQRSSREVSPCDITDSSKQRDKVQPIPSSAFGMLASPSLLVLMVCNMLSFGSSKCIKEWGVVYLRSTQLASSDLQVATLMFWSEVGGSCGAFLSGIVSTRLGGRHALTCMLSAVMSSAALGALVWFCAGALNNERGKMVGSPIPFTVACALQTLSLAGINGVRTLAGLHGAEIASRLGRVGMANAWLEAVGQVGSVLAGQPLGAVAAAVSAAVDGNSADLDSASGGIAIMSMLGLASVSMVLLNVALLPHEASRLAKKANKTD